MSFRHGLATPAFAITVVCCCVTSPVVAQSPTTVPATAPATTQPTSKTYTIENHGELKLAIPAGWDEREDPPQPGIPRTIRLTSADAAFQMLISILPPPPGMMDFNSKTKLRAIAEMQGKHLLGTSKETSVVLEEIKNAPGGGFLYTLSDKAPAAGSYEYITGGVAGVGDLILSTTMLMRERNPPQRAKAMEILVSASHMKAVRAAAATTRPSATPSTSASADVSPVASPATAPTQTPTSQPANDNRLFVSLPDRTWQLAIGQSNLQILQDETSPDRRARHVSAVDPNTGMNIAIFLEPAATIGDARLARSFFFDRLRRSPLQIREDKFTEQGDIARVDYLLPDVNQRHANLYISKEGIWIDVHISVEDAQNEKLPLIDEIAKSVRIEAKARATK